MNQALRIGLYGIGLDTYWDQFRGLYDRLTKYQESIANRIKKVHPEAKVINTGIVDDPVKARQVGETLRNEGVDLIILYVSTYALSSTVLPVVQRAGVPVIVLSLQPTKAIDYHQFNTLPDRGAKTGEWLAYCQSCSAPEIANVFRRSNIDFQLVTGSLDDDESWREIHNWVRAAQIVTSLRKNRIGVLGHYYNGMLDVYSDMTGLSAAFGMHFEILEMCEVLKNRREVSKPEITEKLKQFNNDFNVSPECNQQELKRVAATSVALDKLVDSNSLDALAYYFEGSADPEYENIITSVIAGNTLLTMHNVPVAGEYEIKNAIAMKIMDLMGIGGSFSEFYALDLDEDIVLLGHDGPGSATIAEDKVELVPLPVYHGKPGKGLSIQMSVKNGPVTTLSVVQDQHGVKLLVAEGESVKGPILEIGNTNSRYKFPIGAKEFVNRWSAEGPSHHMAIGVGHEADVITKLGQLLGIPVVQIC